MCKTAKKRMEVDTCIQACYSKNYKDVQEVRTNMIFACMQVTKETGNNKITVQKHKPEL